jgi:hypothetical protein
VNGIYLRDLQREAFSHAAGYPGTDPRYVEKTISDYVNFCRPGKAVNVGQIESAEGMEAELNAKRDAMYMQATVCAPAQFDAIWDTYFEDFMSSGARAIMDEREQKWNQFFPGLDFLPDPE